MKVYTRGMLEIELTTRHSLQKLLTARLLVLGMADFILLAVALGVGGNVAGQPILQMLLYCLVPFNLMAMGCLWIISNCQEQNAAALCPCMGAGIILLLIFLRMQDVDIYGKAQVGGWLLAFGISVVLLALCFGRMYRAAGKYERMGTDQAMTGQI